MFQGKNIAVIIPAYNEEESIGLVLDDLPDGLVNEVIVVDNNSTDHTARVASEKGATVLREPFQGYGAACLRGIGHLRERAIPPDVVVFIDGDHSDHPDQISEVIRPVLDRDVSLVIGSRAIGVRERGAMMPQQVFGNWLATNLVRILYGVRFTDLGPFRAITWDALMALDMKDKTFGWTVEMQVKAAKKGMKVEEVPVRYRRRVGVSKITGTVKGSVMAGYKIIATIFKYI